MISSLDHLNLSIPNFHATVLWYKQVLGFEEVEGGIQGSQPWTILRAGDALLCLYEAQEERADGAMNHIGLRITDRVALEAALAEHKIPVQYGGAYEHPHSTAFYVSDPAGNTLELAVWDQDQIQFPGSGVKA
jgi:catechol-2,3-dioxygenase